MIHPRKFNSTLRLEKVESLFHLCFVGRALSDSLDEDNANALNQMYYAILAVAFVLIVALGIVVIVLWRKLKRLAIIPLTS